MKLETFDPPFTSLASASVFLPDESYALVDAHFGLLDELHALLGSVELLMVGAVKNPRIARAIDREKRLLCAA